MYRQSDIHACAPDLERRPSTADGRCSGGLRPPIGARRAPLQRQAKRSRRPGAARPYKRPNAVSASRSTLFRVNGSWGFNTRRGRGASAAKASERANSRRTPGNRKPAGSLSVSAVERAPYEPGTPSAAIDKTSESREAVTSAGPPPPLSPPQPKRGVRRRQEKVDRSEESEFRS